MISISMAEDRAVRTIKSMVIARKKWLFADTPKGAGVRARYRITYPLELSTLHRNIGYVHHVLIDKEHCPPL